MFRQVLAAYTGLIVFVSAMNDTVFNYDYPNYFEDAMKLQANTSFDVGHGMLARYETEDMVITNDTHAVSPAESAEYSSGTVKKRFDFWAGGLGLAGYYYATGHQELQNTIVGCRGLRYGQMCHSIACLPQLIKFLMGNIFFFGLAVKANAVWTALTQFADSAPRSGTADRSEIKREEGQDKLPPLSALGFNLPQEYLDMYRSVENGSRTYDEVFGFTTTDISRRYFCNGGTHQIRNGDNWWDFDAPGRGIMIQCKESCAMAGVDYDQIEQLAQQLAVDIQYAGALGTQYTVYQKVGLKTLTRCRMVILQYGSDACPEKIDGKGCQVPRYY